MVLLCINMHSTSYLVLSALLCHSLPFLLSLLSAISCTSLLFSFFFLPSRALAGSHALHCSDYPCFPLLCFALICLLLFRRLLGLLRAGRDPRGFRAAVVSGWCKYRSAQRWIGTPGVAQPATRRRVVVIDSSGHGSELLCWLELVSEAAPRSGCGS